MRSMTEAGAPGQGSPIASSATFATRLANASRAAGPPLFFGLRLWVSVCLALYLAFWLELDNPYWAGTTAALVCQPHLGASLRKGWYRISILSRSVRILPSAAFIPNERGRVGNVQAAALPARREDHQASLRLCWLL